MSPGYGYKWQNNFVTHNISGFNLVVVRADQSQFEPLLLCFAGTFQLRPGTVTPDINWEVVAAALQKSKQHHHKEVSPAGTSHRNDRRKFNFD